MKNSLNILLLISVFLLLTTCKKNNTPPDTLPPVTQTGANTFGCKVNGEVWVPYYSCGYLGNPCGEMQVDIHPLSQYSLLPISVSILVNRFHNGDDSYFSIGFETDAQGNIYDSAYINFSGKGVGNPPVNGDYHKSFNTTNTFQITKLDTINKIISGTFYLVLKKDFNDSIVVEDGRFDFKFGSICNCSQ